MTRWIACFWMLLLGISAASACSWDQTITDEQRLSRANSVFIAHVIRTEEIEPPHSGADVSRFFADAPIIRATFRTVEVFKGQPPVDATIRSVVFGGGNCTLPIIAGLDYLVFLSDDTFVSFPKGSRGLPSLRDDLQNDDLQNADTKRLLGMLRNFRDNR
jgi:hypothetical protein